MVVEFATKKLTGLSFIDYKSISEDLDQDCQFCNLAELTNPQQKGIIRSFGGYVVEARIGKGQKGNYARITIEHNYQLIKVMVWTEEYNRLVSSIKNCEKKLVIFDGELKYDAKWAKSNQFTLKENSNFIVL